jgi:hypothetical protein
LAAKTSAHIDELHGVVLVNPLNAASASRAIEIRISEIDALIVEVFAARSAAARVTAHKTPEKTSALTPPTTLT